jgi:DNA-binding MarR family transcriptional regulator
MRAEPFTAGSDPVQIALMEALKNWATGFGELNQHMAAWTGLPTADTGALRHIVWAAQEEQPLSPALLGRRVGMTSAAVTVLLDRLERADLVVRRRDQADRRRVTLHPTASAITQARSFMGAAGVEIAAALETLDRDELVTATAVLTSLTDAVSRGSDRMRSTPPRPTPRVPPQ